MNIIEKKYNFKSSPSVRSTTRRIILHHAAAVSCSADDIQRWHQQKGWAGIGYHFVVRKDGTVYRGRPENTMGAHASGSNSDSIGVCFEGNFMSEDMPEAQKKAGMELVSYLKAKYGIQKVQKHRDVCATSCPGDRFPFENVAAGSSGQGSQAAEHKQVESIKPDQKIEIDKNWVGRLQDEINKQGFGKVTVDQVAGPKTLAACPVVRQGAKGNITRLIQERLISLGFSCGNSGADGTFGINTKNAVIRFQKSKGLSQDGIVGNKTWRGLLGL